MRPANPDHPVARFCRTARATLRATPAEMGRRLNKSKALYYQYEDGSTIPSVELLLEIAKQSGLSLGLISWYAEGRTLPTDPAVLALAAKIADASEEVRAMMERAFGEPADNARVASALGDLPPR